MNLTFLPSVCLPFEKVFYDAIPTTCAIVEAAAPSLLPPNILSPSNLLSGGAALLATALVAKHFLYDQPCTQKTRNRILGAIGLLTIGAVAIKVLHDSTTISPFTPAHEVHQMEHAMCPLAQNYSLIADSLRHMTCTFDQKPGTCLPFQNYPFIANFFKHMTCAFDQKHQILREQGIYYLHSINPLKITNFSVVPIVSPFTSMNMEDTEAWMHSGLNVASNNLKEWIPLLATVGGIFAIICTRAAQEYATRKHDQETMIQETITLLDEKPMIADIDEVPDYLKQQIIDSYHPEVTYDELSSEYQVSRWVIYEILAEDKARIEEELRQVKDQIISIHEANDTKLNLLISSQKAKDLTDSIARIEMELHAVQDKIAFILTKVGPEEELEQVKKQTPITKLSQVDATLEEAISKAYLEDGRSLEELVGLYDIAENLVFQIVLNSEQKLFTQDSQNLPKETEDELQTTLVDVT